MKPTHQRLKLTRKEYWIYFMIPIALSIPAIVINGLLVYHWISPSSYSLSTNQLIWAGNFWLVLAFVSFFRRWKLLFFTEIPIALTPEEFSKTLHRTAWDIKKDNKRYKNEYFRMGVNFHKEEWIVLKRLNDRILITSITNPNRLLISPFNQNFKNILNFKNNIRMINVPKSRFEQKITFNKKHEDILHQFLKFGFYAIIFLLGSIPFILIIHFLLKEGLNSDNFITIISLILYGSLMLFGLYKIISNRS